MNQQKNNHHLSYRADIDGLRAVAVLFVMTYHAFPNIVKGGYIGVDVFFVISGFLITSIILKSLENDGFSFSAFYFNRIKRIYPALITILIATYTIGAFSFFSDELATLGKHTAASLSFVQNFVLYSESGYFSTNAEKVPLMHIWSLGIEEQFYIIYPILFVIWWRAGLNFNLFFMLIILTSLANSQHLVNKNIVAAYFLPQSRFWELATGGLIAYLTTYKRNEIIHSMCNFTFSDLNHHKITETQKHIKLGNILSFIGFILIIISALIYKESSKFPGIRAIIPVAGASLIIFAGEQSWINNKILKQKPLVFIGLISYPLYLWHWPIFSISRILNGENPGYLTRIALIIISITLAWLTYKLIEKPIRKLPGNKRKVIILFGISLLIIGWGWLNFKEPSLINTPFKTKSANLYKSRLRPNKPIGDCFDLKTKIRGEVRFCKNPDKNNRYNFAVIGDSHALSLYNAFDSTSKQKNVGWLFTGKSGCPPLIGIEAVGDDGICGQFNRNAISTIANSGVKTVFLVARWSYYTYGDNEGKGVRKISLDGKDLDTTGSKLALENGLLNTVEYFQNRGINIVIFSQAPMQHSEAYDLIRKSNLINHWNSSTPYDLSVEHKQHLRVQFDANQIISKISKKTKAQIFNPERIFCDRNHCKFYENGSLYYFDDDHLSNAGALKFIPHINSYINTTIKNE